MREQGKTESIGAAAREVATSFRGLVRSEVRLAVAEARESVRSAGRDSLKVGVAAALAAVALLPFMAFLVVGLGRILGDNYWLSSLAVAVLFLALAGGLAAQAIRRIRRFDLSFPHLRETIEEPNRRVREQLRAVSFGGPAQHEERGERDREPGKAA